MPETSADLGFRHRLLGPARPGLPTLLLLHGTGGDENDLLELGAALLPGAAILSPRGKVLENGMTRFFRRLAAGIFDLEDLRRRTHELADFALAAVAAHGLDSRLVAIGLSNGANIAAAMLLLRPEVLSGALLFRAMVPLEPERRPDLAGVRALIASGRQDSIVPADQPERLARMLAEAGAEVGLRWSPGGHRLGGEDLEAGREWFDAGRFERRGGPEL